MSCALYSFYWGQFSTRPEHSLWSHWPGTHESNNNINKNSNKNSHKISTTIIMMIIVIKTTVITIIITMILSSCQTKWLLMHLTHLLRRNLLCTLVSLWSTGGSELRCLYPKPRWGYPKAVGGCHLASSSWEQLANHWSPTLPSSNLHKQTQGVANSEACAHLGGVQPHEYSLFSPHADSSF